ncbi:MAG: hypothetical protein AAFX06_18230, partial [Planctomycetota bacterium]
MSHRRVAWTILLAAIGISSTGKLVAQESEDWRQAARERLEAIYDRGEFRIPNVEARWLDDSSAYRIRETDAENGGSVIALYDTESGERTISEWDPQPGPRQSPDGRLAIETRRGD